MLTTILDLALVIIAFGLIIFFHELGHFLAARWAGIRVLAFALGFGPAAFSWRKGLGLRRGSSEREYHTRIDALAAGATTTEGARSTYHTISPTEYRLNYLPFGGYVKMLGQDDMDPTRTSSARDSYQSCKPWKRMIVISAGVIANIIIAAILFMIVFKVGLPTEPARVGSIAPGSAAGKAIASNASLLGVTQRGLLPGDRVVSINGGRAASFQDLVLASAMARPGKPIELVVERPGLPANLTFSITPETSPISGMLELGIGPAVSTRVQKIQAGAEAEWAAATERAGLRGVTPGMRLASLGPSRDDLHPVESAQAIADALRAADGAPIALAFSDTGFRHMHHVELAPRPGLERADLNPDPKTLTILDHIAGLAPVMRVASVPSGARHGLLPGDVFVRLGAAEYPSIAEGIMEIQSHRKRTIPVVVERTDAQGNTTRVSLTPSVDKNGRIGFGVDDTRNDSTLVARPPERIRPLDAAGDALATPAARSAITRPGTRILAVEGAPVASFDDVRNAIVRACRAALAGATEPQTRPVSITLTISPPIPVEPTALAPTETVTLLLSPDDAQRIAALPWEVPFTLGAFFELEQTTLKADNPLHAVSMGIAETHRWMMMTYATFVRLFQGTVKVEHLKGPVGIAHIGTIVASQGTLKLLFFLALVSVNLAVVNFLPLPIVDGGQFLFLVYEQIKGKPVPEAIQGFATLAGLVLIGCMFLIVTFNDIRGLF
ncbi:MAG: site-2 protease family protein [Phycisphaeraceae bacterium]|nr:site-2 protease family protein [Phycisphaeraceae bacterium]